MTQKIEEVADLDLRINPENGGYRFLDASSNLYERVCPSVRLSVRPSVGPSVTPFQ